MKCHRFESSWTNYVIISVRLRSKYILTSHRLSLSLYYYVFPHISTDIDSLINQNVHMCTCNHLEWLLTLSIRSRSFKIQFWNVLLWQWLHEYCRKKVFLKSYVSKDCTDDKPFTKHIMNYSYKILFTIKSGRLCYQNYLKYINSNLERDLECAVISTVAGRN